MPCTGPRKKGETRRFRQINMARLTVLPEGKIYPLNASVSILNTLLRNGHSIMHRCGGKAQCGTCRIKIVEGAKMNRPGPAEITRLGENVLKEGYRLACQSYAWGDLVIEIAPPDGI